MPDTTTLTSLVFIALGLATWAALLRAISHSESFDLAPLFGRPWEPGWPRGVQEEEPQPWRFDRLRTHETARSRIEAVTTECDSCEAGDLDAAA